MGGETALDGLELGYDIPARPGMPEAEIQTPCLVVDLDALERNILRMKEICADMGVRHRVHAKTHRSADIARLQIETGGAVGVCCQKVAEAEALAREGIKDILVTNQVRDPAKIERLAALPKLGTRVLVCIDDPVNVGELSKACTLAGTGLEALVEIDCGAGRCGVPAGQPAVDLARKIADAPGLSFAGLQAYQGSAQHIRGYKERREAIRQAIIQVRETVALLEAEDLRCEIIGGAGTGSYYFEGTSGIYNEIQAGSYIFMDADYQRVLDKGDQPISTFENALFVLTSVMSTAQPMAAICDAGLKAHSVDSGMPYVFGHPEMKVLGCSDEHTVLADPSKTAAINDRLRLVPGHCDPTCNLHDWFVGVRNGVVEVLWPVTARGKGY